MVRALFDTNILIDYLNAIPQAREEIERFENRAVSIITRMEVMVGADADLVEPTRCFLESFKVIALDDEVANGAVALRRVHRIKLPHAVIWATAQTAGRLLVTRNTQRLSGRRSGDTRALRPIARAGSLDDRSRPHIRIAFYARDSSENQRDASIRTGCAGAASARRATAGL